MKGMNTTLILKESGSQQSDTLQSIFRKSCTKHGVPVSQQDALVQNGISLFEMNTAGDIFPLSSYSTISQYVTAHHGDSSQTNEPNDLTRKQLYKQLAKAATSHDMKEYRRLRKQYSAAV